MTAIGSLVFCDDCGNLLESNKSQKQTTLKCDVCGATCKDTAAKVITTRSKPSDFPSALRQKHSQFQTESQENANNDAEIDRPCEKCAHPFVKYYTMQLRGADEGSTVFYTCPNCQHTWNEQN